MWEQFGRRSTKRSGGAVALPFGALEKARGRFGRSETRQAQGAFGGAVGIGVGVVAIAATIALVLFLRRRRAARQDSSTEEVNEGSAE
jgi:hypothetical protein